MAVKCEPIQSAKQPDAVWIGVYRWRYYDYAATYSFVAGEKESMVKRLPWSERAHNLSVLDSENLSKKAVEVWFKDSVLVAVRRVPRVWAADINLHVDKKGGDKRIANLGNIIYHCDNKGEHASALSYYPRDSLGKYTARKIPYFMEAIAIHDLEKKGVIKVSQTHRVLAPREKQLARVELPLNTQFELTHWLKQMGLGIRQHLAAIKTGHGGLRKEEASSESLLYDEVVGVMKEFLRPAALSNKSFNSTSLTGSIGLF